MIEVKARVTGYLDKVLFEDGAVVTEGQVLCKIDPRPFEVELKKTTATLTQTETALARTEADYRRAVGLRQTGSISAEEFDKAKAEYGAAEAAIGVAKAQQDGAKLNLIYTEVRVPNLGNGAKSDAPRTGRVSRRLKDVGNLIKADETALTTIVTLDPMYVYFDVDERTVLTLRGLIEQKKIRTLREMTFRFELANDEGTFPYRGKIDFEDNKLDTGTGTLQIRGIFDNAKQFAPGLFVRLRLDVGVPRKVVLVPERALGTDQGQKFLYAVKKDTDKEGKPAYKAEYRGGKDLQIGALRDGWRVIEKGVAPGELVLWSGLQRVRKDSSITIKQQEPPSNKG
jgi:RND family efflux transporter MFP subunit